MSLLPIVVIMSILEGLILLGHIVFYQVFTFVYNISGKWKIFSWWVFAFLSVSFIATSLISSITYLPWMRPLYTFSAIWLGTLLWLFAASVAISVLLPFRNLLPLTTISSILFGLAILVSVYGLFHSEQVKITSYSVELPNLTATWENKKIALVADTHLGYVRGSAFAEKVGKLINAQAPEMVLVAGDFYDGPPVQFTELAKAFANVVSAPKGIFYANGNHEEFSNNDKYTKALKEAGITVLKNSVKTIDDLQIAGIDYNNTTSDEKTKTVLAGLPLDPTLPSILIKHAPTGIPAVAEKGFDLQVSGHTHTGQVWPGPILTRKIFGKYFYGHNIAGSLQVITTSGAGTWGPPQRIGTDAEIVIITLTAKKLDR